MAVRRERLAGWRGVNGVETVIAYVTFNDANGNVLMVEVDNHSWGPITFEVWRHDNPNLRLLVTVPVNPVPGVFSVYDDEIPSNTKYSDRELPIGDPKGTNFNIGYVG